VNPLKAPLAPRPAPIPPESADIATPFQLMLSCIPMAMPAPWLAIEPAAPAGISPDVVNCFRAVSAAR
jgi:hypothetical protein